MSKNSFKVIFKSEDNEAIFISMDSPEQITSEMTSLILSDLRADISKIVYPINIPKTKKHLLSSMEGFTKNLNVPLEESKVETWESAGFGGVTTTYEVYMSEEYMKDRGIIKADLTEKQLERYSDGFALMEEVKELNKDLKDMKITKCTFGIYFKTLASDKKEKKS